MSVQSRKSHIWPTSTRLPCLWLWIALSTMNSCARKEEFGSCWASMIAWDRIRLQRICLRMSGTVNVSKASLCGVFVWTSVTFVKVTANCGSQWRDGSCLAYHQWVETATSVVRHMAAKLQDNSFRTGNLLTLYRNNWYLWSSACYNVDIWVYGNMSCEGVLKCCKSVF